MPSRRHRAATSAPSPGRPRRGPAGRRPAPARAALSGRRALSGLVALAALAVLGAGAAPVVTEPAAPAAADLAPTVLTEGRGEAAADRDRTREQPRPSPAADASEAVAELTLPDAVGERWAVDAAHVRPSPSTDGDPLLTLDAGDKIDITGRTADGWTEVRLESSVGWVLGELLSEDEPVAAATGVSGAACATTPGIEASLQANAAAAYRAVCAAFPGVASSYGGYRAGDGGDHGSGHALDIMVSGQAGWDIVAYLQAHAGELGITYLIFEQQMWTAGDPAGAWEGMADRGSPTANHYDHVHVSTS